MFLYESFCKQTRFMKMLFVGGEKLKNDSALNPLQI